MSANALDELNEYLSLYLRSGFYTPQEALTAALEVVEEFEGSAERVQQLLDTQLSQLSLEQSQWPALTDCQRLDTALRELEQQGIVARQNFTCCGNCGSTEIWDEIEPAHRGYVFYHMQDTERAVEGGGLYFNYGAVDGQNPLQIASMLVQSLTDSGLQPQWDGTIKTRVFVPLVWQRPVKQP